MDPFLVGTGVSLVYDWWKNRNQEKQQQQFVDTQANTNAGQLQYMYDAMAKDDQARQEAMRLQQAMFEKSLAEQQRGTDMSALYAKGAMGMNLAGTLQQQQANLDQQIKLAQMQQAQTQPQRMAQASAMQALPQLQRLMGMTAYKLPTSTVENNYSTLGQNVLGDYFKTLQATQPFLDQMMPQQASNASTNPLADPRIGTLDQYGLPITGVSSHTADDGSRGTVSDPGGFFDVPPGVGAAIPTNGTNNGVTVGGAGLTAPTAQRAPQISQDNTYANQAPYNPEKLRADWLAMSPEQRAGMNRESQKVALAAGRTDWQPHNPNGPALTSRNFEDMRITEPTRENFNGSASPMRYYDQFNSSIKQDNLTMPTQYTNSPTTISTLPDGTAFIMPINGTDQYVNQVTNTGQPVSSSPIPGFSGPGSSVNGTPNLVNGVPNMSTTGPNTGPATTTNPLEVDTALMNTPTSQLIQNSPLYQYQSKENEDAIRRMMAQRGLLNSSHTLSATSKAAQALSANEADKQVGRLSAMYNAALGQPINMPTTQGFQLSNMGNTGQDMSSLGNIYNQAAQNRANSYSSFGNTMGNAITNAGQSAGQNMANYGNAWAQGNTMSNLANYGMSNTGTDWGKTLIDLGNHYGWGQTTAPKSSGVSSSFNDILSGFGSLWR